MIGLILGIASLAIAVLTWRMWLKRAFRQSLSNNFGGFMLVMADALGLRNIGAVSAPRSDREMVRSALREHLGSL